MMMRFRGGGVGHKSTREATNQFRVDLNPMDILSASESDDSELESNAAENSDDGEETEGEDNGSDESNHAGSGSDGSMEWQDVDDDSLGAEDGVDVASVVEDLGFAEL
jgi:hypothetical protein